MRGWLMPSWNPNGSRNSATVLHVVDDEPPPLNVDETEPRGLGGVEERLQFGVQLCEVAVLVKRGLNAPGGVGPWIQ